MVTIYALDMFHHVKNAAALTVFPPLALQGTRNVMGEMKVKDLLWEEQL